MMKEIDIPPLWLALALLASWALAQVWAWPLVPVGSVLVLLGLVLMAVAVLQMLGARTSFIPRRDPQALVTGGVFRISRNPIYLGDAMVLLGAILCWGGLLALPLVPLFILLITQRYIKDEESRLCAGFGAAYQAWAARVPRWIWRF